MMRPIGALLLGLALLVTMVVISCKPTTTTEVVLPPTTLITDSSWVVPLDVDSPATQIGYYDFGWQTFVALNWPADLGARGKPDMTATIGATGPDGLPRPTVWQTYKEQFDLFLDNGATPGSWDSPNAGHDPDGIGGKIVLAMFSKQVDGMVDEKFNEATGNPLIDMDSNYVRYEVKLDQSEYEYFLQNEYFNADNQKHAVHVDSFVGMPRGNDPLSQGLNVWARFGSTEVKAAWRILPEGMPESQKNRYFWAKAILIGTDGKPSGEATVGLHILRLTPLTPSTWYWASFEQEDNLTPQKDAQGNVINPSFNTNPPTVSPNGYNYIPTAVVPNQPLPVQAPVLVSSPPFQNIPSDLVPVNKKWQAALKGTVWEHYMMVGTVNPAIPGSTSIAVTGEVFNDSVKGWPVLPAIQVNTADMANSTLETYMYNANPPSQSNLNNCVVCHAGGTPQFFVEDTLKVNGNLQVFTFLFGFAQSPQ
jgi:hypothetical protein